MNKLKVWIFKESGKWYTEDTVMIPDNLYEVFQILEWLTENYKCYNGMHLVIPFTEDFVNHGYPSMIPADRRIR